MTAAAKVSSARCVCRLRLKRMRSLPNPANQGMCALHYPAVVPQALAALYASASDARLESRAAFR